MAQEHYTTSMLRMRTLGIQSRVQKQQHQQRNSPRDEDNEGAAIAVARTQNQDEIPVTVQYKNPADGVTAKQQTAEVYESNGAE